MHKIGTNRKVGTDPIRAKFQLFQKDIRVFRVTDGDCCGQQYPIRLNPMNENKNEEAADNSEIQIKQFNLATIKQINNTMRKLAGIWLLGLLAFLS